MALRTFDQWRWGGPKPEPEHATIKFDPEQVVHVTIGDERKTFEPTKGKVIEFLPCNDPSWLDMDEIPLNVESTDITEKPRKFSKVNCFKEQDWCKIKGIGSKLAKKLVESGPYMSIEEIAKVKGVGKAILENIKVTLLDENQQAEE